MGVIGYILGLVFITSLSLVSLIFFLLNTDPGTLKRLEFVIFYLSFFLTISGIFTLIGAFIRKINTPYHLSWKMIRPALRQAMIIALVFTLFLILAAQQLLNWLVAILILISACLFEYLTHLWEKPDHAKGIRKN